MNELALFAGAGGGILAGHMLGWRTVVAVERDAYAAQVLAQRQNDGALRPFPIWSDVRSFDGRPWRGRVDVVSGGFPCQDISVAGKGAGIDGERSGMWTHMARIIGEVRPRFAFVENSPAILTRGLGRVLGDLAALGYDCRWTVLGAADVGAPHQRDRFWCVGWNTDHGRCPWINWPKRALQDEDADAAGVCEHVADADCVRELQPQGGQRDQRRRPGDGSQELADTNGQSWHQGRQGDAAQEPRRRNSDRGGFVADLFHADSAGLAQRQGQRSDDEAQLAAIERTDWWESEPDVGRVANGVAHRVDRLKALGNGQVPRCAATAWRMLTGGVRNTHNAVAHRTLEAERRKGSGAA
jgi:DNA (cytosine-5)-methyltransferase 1